MLAGLPQLTARSSSFLRRDLHLEILAEHQRVGMGILAYPMHNKYSPLGFRLLPGLLFHRG